MAGLEDFARDLRDALSRLYDPTYVIPSSLFVLTGGRPAARERVQAVLVSEIEQIRPGSDVPPAARLRRIYDVLACRYLQQMTQEQAAERLGLTERHLRREQQAATYFLASRIWSRAHGLPAEAVLDEAPESASGNETAQWQQQVQQEIHVLQAGTARSVVDVRALLQGVASLVRPLLQQRGVELFLAPSGDTLLTEVHPPAARQVLVSAIISLAATMTAGVITVSAHHGDKTISIELAATPGRSLETGSVATDAAGAQPEADQALIDSLLASQDGSARWQVSGDTGVLAITLPSAGRIKVLVVDDNADLIHFYERYTQLTCYSIVSLRSGANLFETVEEVSPSIIVLDVMLPDVDGWELLVHLGNHPATRSIPVIICSVVRQEALALSLGAACYLPKPVRRQDFLRALDQALSRDAAGSGTDPERSAVAC